MSVKPSTAGGVSSKPPIGGIGRKPGVVPSRAKSVQSKPSKPQVRIMKDSSSASSQVHKTKSETSLVDDFKNLSIRRTTTRSRVASARQGCKTLANIVEYITKQKVKNIVVMTGAGISTPSGIPDFRSPGTGLYDNLRQYRIPYPEAVFDSDYFEGNPKPFYTLSKELYPTGKYRPNYIHYFLKLLDRKGLLLRAYTQNIDGLERMCGIPAQKLVEAHGSFLTASCVKCKLTHPAEEIKTAVYSDKIPRCKKGGCLGLVKPDIVFFGEDLPKRFYYYLKDFPQADLLLVMGTSLEVEPFAGLVDSVRFYIPRVLINRKAVGPFQKRRRANDVAVEGDIIEKLKDFVELLGWRRDMDQLLEDSETEVENYLKQNSLAVESSPSAKTSDASNPSPPKSQASASARARLDSASSVKSTVSSTSRLIPPTNHQRLLNSRRLPSNGAARNTGGSRGGWNRGGPQPWGSKQNVPQNKSWLPRIQFSRDVRPSGFHAQKRLYWTPNDDDDTTSSSDESEDSDSSDD